MIHWPYCYRFQPLEDVIKRPDTRANGTTKDSKTISSMAFGHIEPSSSPNCC